MSRIFNKTTIAFVKNLNKIRISNKQQNNFFCFLPDQKT